jgi:hypothetical protein
MRGHIKNIYELTDLPIGDLFEMIDAFFTGDHKAIKSPVEKMDGQNLTFTVINNELRFFFKGTTLASIKSGGLNHHGICDKYSSENKESVRNAYLDAYSSLRSVVSRHKGFFNNGKVVVEAALIDPKNMNTIPYKNSGIYFIQAWDLERDARVNNDSYRALLGDALRTSTKIPIMKPHPVKLQKCDVSFEEVIEICDEIGKILVDYDLNDDHTVGDLVTSLVESHIGKYSFIPAKIRRDAAQRLVYNKGPIAAKFKQYANPEAWDRFKKLQRKRRLIVAEARIPFDNVIQKIGAIAFRPIDFKLQAHPPEQIKKGVSIIREAFVNSRLIGTVDQIDEIRILLKCIEANEHLIEKSTEGFVFEWKGRETKLVGMFTPVNRLNALFSYGKDPVTFAKRTYWTRTYSEEDYWHGW